MAKRIVCSVVFYLFFLYCLVSAEIIRKEQDIATEGEQSSLHPDREIIHIKAVPAVEEPTSQPTGIPFSLNFSIFTSNDLMIENYIGNSVHPAAANYSITVLWGDSNGNIFTNAGNQLIRKVFNYGQSILSFAGNGSSIEIIENVTATATGIGQVSGIMGDTMGNIYYTDTMANVVRKISANDLIVNTIAGIPYTCGETHTGVSATSTSLCAPRMLWIDAFGDIFLTSYEVPQVTCLTWKTENTYIVKSFISAETTGVDFINLAGIGGDTNGNIYVSDIGIRAVYRIVGEITGVVAGGGEQWDSTTPTSALLINPCGIWVDTLGNLYFTNDNQVLYLNLLQNSLTIVAGSANYGYLGDGSAPIDADFADVIDIWSNWNGDLFIADNANSRIRKVPSANPNTILLVTDYINGDGEPATAAITLSPRSLWGDSVGNLYFIDLGFCIVRKVEVNTGLIITIGGTNKCFTMENDGEPFNVTQLTSGLMALTGDTLGNIYVLDNTKIKVARVEQNNEVTIINNPVVNSPSYFASIVSLRDGSIIIACADEHAVTKLAPSGQFTPIAGIPFNPGSSGDGGQAINAYLNGPHGIWIDSLGNGYIADTYNHKIRKVSTAEIISSFAGSGLPGFLDDVPAVLCGMNKPYGITGDSNGVLFIADNGNNRIRMIYSEGPIYYITTIIGNGKNSPIQSTLTVPTVAKNSPFSAPEWIWVDPENNIYTIENYNNKSLLRKTSFMPNYGRTMNSPSVDLTFIPSLNPVMIPEKDVPYEVIAGVATPGDYTDFPISTIWGDTNGNLYTDANGQLLCNVTDNGAVVLIIAGTPNYVNAIQNDQFANVTFIHDLADIWGDTSGNLFYVDYGGNLLVEIVAKTKTIQIITSAKEPNDYIWGNTAGELYFSQSEYGKWNTNCVKKLDTKQSDLNVTTVFCDLLNPAGIWGDTTGMIYVISQGDGIMWEGNATFRRQIGGKWKTFDVTDDVTYDTEFSEFGFIGGSINGIWVNTVGTVYFTDKDIVAVYHPLTTTTQAFAGEGTAVFDGVHAKDSALLNPSDVWGDTIGSIFIADSGNNRIRRVDTNNIIHTVHNFHYGEGGPSNLAHVGRVSGMWGDSVGNLLFVDQSDCVIRKVSFTGIITTVGGTFTCVSPTQSELFANFNETSFTSSISGFWIDSTENYYFIDKTNLYRVSSTTNLLTNFHSNVTKGSYATVGLVGDNSGNFYISVPSQSIVRKLSANGIVTTKAGTSSGYGGDGGPATTAKLNSPLGIWIDSLNSLYIADQGNNRVRKVTSSSGIISTIAGNGYNAFSASQESGPATSTNLNKPTQITGDANGNLYVADFNNFMIRMLTPITNSSKYSLTTVIGSVSTTNPYAGLSSPGYPFSMWMDSKNGILYTTFNGSFEIIYKTVVSSGYKVVPLVGAAVPSQYSVNTLWGDTNGDLFCDLNQQYIMKLTNGGTLTSKVAGTGEIPSQQIFDGVPANSTAVVNVTKIWGDTIGNLYYIDRVLQVIVEIAAVSKVIRVIAEVDTPLRMWGSTLGQLYFTEAGQTQCIATVSIYNPLAVPACVVEVFNARGIWGDSTGNLYYIAGHQGELIKSNGGNNQHTLIGVPLGEDDTTLPEPAQDVQLTNIVGLWVDSFGNIYFNNRSLLSGIAVFNPSTGLVENYAGTKANGYFGDGGPATSAALNQPSDIWGDSNGNLFIADTENNRVRKITTNGIIYTVVDYLYGNGGPSTLADIQVPTGMWADSLGNVFYVDAGHCAIRRVSLEGIIVSLGGTFTCAYSADGQPANATAITEFASGFWGDTIGNYYYTDYGNLRKINPAENNIVTTLFNSVTNDTTYSTYTEGTQPISLAGDNNGNLFVTVPDQHVIRRYGLNIGEYYGIFAGVYGVGGYNGDGLPATATIFYYPGGTWINSNGVMYVVDQKNHRIRQIRSNIVSTVAGTGISGYNGDYILATHAELNNPCSISGDVNGKLYVADRDNNRVRILLPTEAAGVYIIESVVRYSEGYFAPIVVSVVDTEHFLLLEQIQYFYFISEIYPKFVAPSSAPSSAPTRHTPRPTVRPSMLPSSSTPTVQATSHPSGPSLGPTTRTPTTLMPTYNPTTSNVPTYHPSKNPTQYPTLPPSLFFVSNFIVGNIMNYNGTNDYVSNSSTVVTLWGDTNGNLFSDANGIFIRQISNYGVTVLPIAGSSSFTGGFDGLYATDVSLSAISKVWGDTIGNLFFIDRGMNVVGKIIATTSKVQVISTFKNPQRMWGNTAGVLFITQLAPQDNCIVQLTPIVSENSYNQSYYRCSDQLLFSIWGDSNNQIYFSSNLALYELNAAAQVTLIVGSPNANNDEVESDKVDFSTAQALWGDTNGNIIIANTGAQTVLFYNRENKHVKEVAGNGTGSFSGDGGPATEATLYSPTDVWVDTNGNIFIADSSNYRVRKVTPDGIIYTVLDYLNGDGSSASLAFLSNPNSLRGDTSGNIYYIDQGDCVIRRISSPGIITTIGGDWSCGSGGLGLPNSISLTSLVTGLWIDKVGNSYFIDQDSIRFAPSTNYQNISIICSGITNSGYGRGESGSGNRGIYSLIGDNLGSLFVSFPEQNLIKHFIGSIYKGIFAGILSKKGYNGDNIAASNAMLYYPTGMWMNSNGVMFVADRNNNRIRAIINGMILTVAGTGGSGFNGDHIRATSSLLNAPNAITGDILGNLYIADQDNYKVRMLSLLSDGTYLITTIIGSGNPVRSVLGSPTDLWIDSNENLYVLQNYTSYFTIIKARAVSLSFSPTRLPSCIPTVLPSELPTSTQPSEAPSLSPSLLPTMTPTVTPSNQPTVEPSTTANPTTLPSSLLPTTQPTLVPTIAPSIPPTVTPSGNPTLLPSYAPTVSPTQDPSAIPTANPSIVDSNLPTDIPTLTSSTVPAVAPSSSPSATPTTAPSMNPTSAPTFSPTWIQTINPSQEPTLISTVVISFPPTLTPTVIPSASPSGEPTVSPTFAPTSILTAVPECDPTELPTFFPSTVPTDASLSLIPSVARTWNPTSIPVNPSSQPAFSPTLLPSETPTSALTNSPSYLPTLLPSFPPNAIPSYNPSGSPTFLPTTAPTVTPSLAITVAPRTSPNAGPSAIPSHHPTLAPSNFPTIIPSYTPSAAPVMPLVPALVVNTVNTVTNSSVISQVMLSNDGIVNAGIFSTSVKSPATSQIISQNVNCVTKNRECSVIFQGLTAASNYSVYFYTKSVDGISSTLDEVLQSKQIITTACCRPIYAILRDTKIIEGQNYPSFISFSVSSLLQELLTVKLQLNRNASLLVESSNIPSALIPSQISFSNVSTSISIVAVNSLSKGKYYFSAALAGREAASYRVIYSGFSAVNSMNLVNVYMASFTVLPTNVTLPAPVLSQAIFSNDGSYVIVSFNALSNQAGLSVGSSFYCSQVLNFPCVTESTCQWIDGKTIYAYVPTGATCSLNLGDKIKLSSQAIIKAQCASVAACVNYNQWPVSNVTVAVSVGPALSPITPTVVLSIPKTIGACSSLSLDLTSSTGNGGRSWKCITITVASTSSNSTSLVRLKQFLSAVKSINQPTVVPASYLTGGDQYSFTAILCNFMDQCGQSAGTLSIVSHTIPVVTIAGTNILTMTRSEVLSLITSTQLSTCGSIISGGLLSSLSFSWRSSVSSDGNTFSVAADVLSTSKDPSRFLLPAYSLTASRVYEIEVNVTYSLSGTFATASVQVIVQEGSVVAVIQGSSAQNVRVMDSLTLDASKSYDEDVEGAYGKAAGLQYKWSCIQTQPVLNTSCGSMINERRWLSSVSATTMILTALRTAANYEGQVTVTVIDSSNSRSSSISVIISILPALLPTISLTTPNSQINGGQTLQVTGTISFPATTGGNATWQIVTGTANKSLSSIALTPISQQFPRSSTTQSYTMFLAIPPNSLTVGTSYTFGLLAVSSYEGKSVTGSIVISINSPPILGSFTISPTSGQEIIQSFNFLCSEWVDQNLPLSYQFSYMSAAGNKIVLRSLSIVSFALSVLPAGSKANNNTLTTVADIYDSLHANSTTTFSVHVYPAAASSSQRNNGSVLTSYITQSLNPSSWNNVDDIIQGTAIANYLLNQVNCSLPENYCSSRNRNPCSTTALTCGSCLSSSFIGTSGDSNDPCYSLDTLKATKSNVTAKISGSLKECAGNCSGHGVCTYSSIASGQSLSGCYEGDITCTTSCICYAGYTLSNNCELSDAEVQQKRALRDQVIAGIQQYVSLQNPSEQSVSSWISSVNDATQNPNELSSSSILSALNIANYAVNVVQSNGYESSSISDVLTSFDSLASAVSFFNSAIDSSAKGRRALDTSSIAGGANVMESLTNYSHVIGQQLLPGQAPSTSLRNNFQITIQSIVPSSSSTALCLSNVSIAVPQSSLNSFLGVIASTVSLPSCPGSDVPSLSISLVSLSAALYGNQNFKSNPLTLLISTQPCENPSNCTAEIVLQSDNSGKGLISKAVNVTYRCKADDSQSSFATCPDGSQYPVNCKGKSESVIVTCPAVQSIPTCNGLFQNSPFSIGCKVLNYTDSTTTCSCPIIVTSNSSNGNRRSLSSDALKQKVFKSVEVFSHKNFTEVGATSAQVSYVGMLEQIKGNFETTVLSAADLNASTVETSWTALVTLGSLVAAFAMAMLLSHYTDNKTKNKIEMDDKLASTVSLIRGRKRTDNFRKKHYNNDQNQSVTMLADEALPEILRSQTLGTRIWNEMKRYHRWIGIVYYYSPQFPRVLRVISLATNIIIMLFIQSLTYSLTSGDDGTCESLDTESACLAPVSAYGTGESKCYWLPSIPGSKTSGTCNFVQPDDSIKIMIFVAIFSALVSTPIALFADWIIHRILSAPDEPQLVKNEKLASISPVMDDFSVKDQADNLPDRAWWTKIGSQRRSSAAQQFRAIVEKEFKSLKDDIAMYRSKILSKDNQKEFDDLWGLDQQGGMSTWERTELQASSFIFRFKNPQVQQRAIALTIKNDLQMLHARLEKESQSFSMISAERWKMKRLLFLFQKDLIPGILGEILDSKDSRDNVMLTPIPRNIKIMAWLLLGALNSGLLFYVFLFAVSQDSHRQAAWGMSFGAWLVTEIVLVSSMMVIFMHIFLPSLLMRDVMKIKKRLLQSIAQYYEKMDGFKGNNNEMKGKGRKIIEEEVEEFNAAKYLFLSYRLAERFPELKASKIILQFTTPWPKQSYQHIADVKAKYTDSSTGISRSISIVLIFLLSNLLGVPLAVQDMIIHMCMTAGVGYTVLLHLQLYEIYPVLVVVPALFIGFIIHFYFISSKKQDVLNRAELRKITRNNDEIRIKDSNQLEGKLHVKQDDLLSPPVIISSPDYIKRRKSLAYGIQLSSQVKRVIAETKNGESATIYTAVASKEILTEDDQFNSDDDAYDSNDDEEQDYEGEEVNFEEYLSSITSTSDNFLWIAREKGGSSLPVDNERAFSPSSAEDVVSLEGKSSTASSHAQGNENHVHDEDDGDDGDDFDEEEEDLRIPLNKNLDEESDFSLDDIGSDDLNHSNSTGDGSDDSNDSEDD